MKKYLTFLALVWFGIIIVRVGLGLEKIYHHHQKSRSKSTKNRVMNSKDGRELLSEIILSSSVRQRPLMTYPYGLRPYENTWDPIMGISKLKRGIMRQRFLMYNSLSIWCLANVTSRNNEQAILLYLHIWDHEALRINLDVSWPWYLNSCIKVFDLDASKVFPFKFEISLMCCC